MLGRFLELALVVEDPGAAWLRYQQQGFAPAEAGDLWSHAYGVVACQGFALGLHARGAEDFSIVFVRPDVAALHRALGDCGVQVERARLGSDVFNELSVREPGGHMVRVLEARSFSPPAELPLRTQFGSFLSLGLPCRDLSKAADFWRRMDFVVAPVPDPWEGFAVLGTPLTCHARREMPEPALLFDQAMTPAPLAGRGHSLLRTAEDLAVIVFA